MAASKNTLIMMGEKSLSIKPRLINELVYYSEESNISLSALFNDALDWWLQVKADAILKGAQNRRRDQKV
ncbi:MAG TPA: hypothetical protein VGF96_16280 [Terracidiphilus sp.]|jgi:hypothetical protein